MLFSRGSRLSDLQKKVETCLGVVLFSRGSRLFLDIVFVLSSSRSSAVFEGI